jgi:proline iminopeptidase
MFVEVNGSKLFFDVEGTGLVPDGPTMRAKPTLLLLHGGPDFDHTLYRPAFSALADIAQIIYLDHRGNGRSSGDDPKTWNLAQWGDDVRAFRDMLGIEKPIVYGASFGGMVALAYATRHPEHPGKLMLVSTEAAGTSHPERRVALFERLGGPEAGELARRRFLEGKLDAEDMEAWERSAFPVYTRRPRDRSYTRLHRTLSQAQHRHCRGQTTKVSFSWSKRLRNEVDQRVELRLKFTHISPRPCSPVATQRPFRWSRLEKMA